MLATVAAWFWPRPGPPTSNNSVGDQNAIGQVVQAGGDIHFHAPPAEALHASAVRRHTAGLSVIEFSALLEKADAFHRKDIVSHYAGKSFQINGRIKDISKRDTYCRVYVDMAISSDAWPVSVSVLIPAELAHDLKNVNTPRWHFSCDAILDSDNPPSPYMMRFVAPEHISVVPYSV